ncbi:tonsoku-like protein [Chiloscyllium plagiosum]|uniref:tonsoku-like protein n=1 Tax=Chiloscyllium plagiosum TaxID=36176 RepID=UPI001CB7CA18|nr:tonsoku-like protein [Chiloscyllium plagiosum]
MLGEFANAKVYLQKALSLVPPTQREHNTIRKHLRRAMKGIELQESLSTLPPDHHRGTMRIYEKLGDLCCKVTGYQRGLEYYQKQLACAENLKLPDEERAMIYFSLGSTYFDLKDYKQAISHYETELIFQEDHPREKCKTWLHLAAAKGMDGAGSNEVDRCYQNALQLAKESNDPRLQTDIHLRRGYTKAHTGISRGVAFKPELHQGTHRFGQTRNEIFHRNRPRPK